MKILVKYFYDSTENVNRNADKVLKYYFHFLQGWEGSDDWLRLQFKAYLLCLMSTVEQTAAEERKLFCLSFVYKKNPSSLRRLLNVLNIEKTP